MKFTLIMSSTLLVGGLLISTNSFAYETEKPVEECKLPKILDFDLPIYEGNSKHEVPPESPFSFKITGRGADHNKVKVNAKGKALVVEISKNSSFIEVKGKIPAEFTGQFVRFDIHAGTEIGCHSKEGWLVKVAGAKAAPSSEPTPESVSETPVAPSDAVVSEPTAAH